MVYTSSSLISIFLRRFIFRQFIGGRLICGRFVLNFSKLLFVILFAFLLGACSTGGGKKLKADGELVAEEPELDENGLPKLVKIPNPYDAQTIEISAEARTAFGEALAEIEKKNWQNAEILLQDMTAKFPHLSGPFVNLGIVYQNLEKLELSEQALRKAIEVNKLNVDAYTILALQKREVGQFAEAEALYKESLAVWPHSIESHRNLGILYDLYMGKFDLALEHYEMCSRLLDQPDKTLRGWIIDLKRRMSQQQKNSAQGGT